ncbi:MAG: hypothetical protein WCX88_02840, partial [Patescibacteria group bacterium]
MNKLYIFLTRPIILFCLAILILVSLIIVLIPMDWGQSANVCSTTAISSPTFVKTYHIREDADGFGVFPTKDGGYLLTGEAIWGSGMAAPYPYIARTDSKGEALWTKDFSSQANALGSLSSSYVGRLAVETVDGNIVTASDIVDFNDDKYEEVKEVYGDILVTKMNSKGTQLWSLLLGDYSLDRPLKMWASTDGGVLLLSQFAKTGYGNNIADLDAVPKYTVLIKIDKNGVVQSSKKMNWDVIDMQRFADGSFVALANIAVAKTEQPENILGPEVVMHDLPTIIRLDSNLKVVWAKSMEMIPTEINAPTSITSTGFTMGKTKIRLAGGEFKAIQIVSDGSFLVFGFNNLLLTQGLSAGATISSEDIKLRPLVAVKFDAKGNYKWAKKLTTYLQAGGSFLDFHVAKTTDGHFIIMKGVVRNSDTIDAKTQDAAQKRQAFLNKCDEVRGSCDDERNLSAELQALDQATNDALKVLADVSANNVELIKVDADFNPMWVKKYDVERSFEGYSLQATSDNGMVLAGDMLTTKMHMTISGLEPYKEAILIKTDANGEASGCASVSSHPEATLEDRSQYLVSQDMVVASGENKVMS